MKFLVLQHAPHEGLGRYRNLADERGIQLNVVELWKAGYKMPSFTDYHDYDAAILMGGPQGANDTPEYYPSRNDEIRFIQSFDGPILGHCLGSQLGAAAFGGRVYHDKRKECGFYPVSRIYANSMYGRLFHGFSDVFDVFHWHGDSFETPDGAVPLAYSRYDPPEVQAFAYGDRFFGVLFHVEMTKEMIADLLHIDREWFERQDREINHGNTADSIMQKAADVDAQMEEQAKILFGNFVSMVQSPVLL